MYPSFIAMAVTGFLMLLLLYTLYNNDEKLTTYQKVVILMGLAIIVSIHGLAHAYSEINFGFNPLKGDFTYEKNKRLINF